MYDINPDVTALSTSRDCRSQTRLVFTFCCRYTLSITTLIEECPFLNWVDIFWLPLYNL